MRAHARKNNAARGQVVAGKNDEKVRRRKRKRRTRLQEEEEEEEEEEGGAGADGSQWRKRKVVRL